MEKYSVMRYVFIAVAISYLIYATKKVGEKECTLPAEVINLSLEAERLWLSVEREEQKQKAQNEQIELEDIFELSEESQIFLKNLQKTIGHSEKYTPLFQEIWKIVDSNKHLSSVSSNYIQDPENIYLSSQNTFMILRKVGILTHTKNVVEAIIECAQQDMSKDLFSLNAWPLAISAAAHDLGKIARQNDEVEIKKHHASVSAEMLAEILEKYDFEPLIKKQLTNAVAQHHRYQHNTSETPNALVSYLIKADTFAREKEISELSTKENIASESINDKTKKNDLAIEVLADYKKMLWSLFTTLIAKKQGAYYFNGTVYIELEHFEESVKDFFIDRNQPEFYLKAGQFKADTNLQVVLKYLSNGGFLLSKDNFAFSLIDIQYGSATSGRWKKGVPCYAIKRSALEIDENELQGFVRSAPKLNAIRNIVFSNNKNQDKV